MDLAGALQALEGAGIGCDAEIGPYEGGGSGRLGDALPERQFECQVDGVRVSGSEWSEPAGATAALVVIAGFGCVFDGAGPATQYFAGERWIISTDPEADSPEATELLARMGEALESEPQSFDCPDRQGGSGAAEEGG